MRLRSLIPLRSVGAACGAALLVVLLLLAGALPPGGGALAQPAGPGAPAALPSTPPDPDPRLVRAADQVALAYVVTGDAAVDADSLAGLRGLSQVLALRTTVEPAPPIGIDPDRDDLSLLTFLYWPVTDSQPSPSPQGYVRLNRFLRSGGVILLDTRDGDIAGIGGPDASAALRRLAGPLDIPPLAPVPPDHVLTRSFYLLEDFPGRYHGAPLWAEAPRAGAEAVGGAPFRQLNDGVSPVLIGANAWAEAWATDERGLALHGVGMGLDGEHQREMAYRFGVNLLMYVLTGNYKSDQVHVPALLERLRREEPGQGEATPADGDGLLSDGALSDAPLSGFPPSDAPPGGADPFLPDLPVPLPGDGLPAPGLDPVLPEGIIPGPAGPGPVPGAPGEGAP